LAILRRRHERTSKIESSAAEPSSAGKHYRAEQQGQRHKGRAIATHGGVIDLNIQFSG
jgi:hypothetical protein